jgi:hypothetical protein
LALVNSVLLKNKVERQQQFILVLDKLAEITVRKVFLIVNAREEQEHEGVE